VGKEIKGEKGQKTTRAFLTVLGLRIQPLGGENKAEGGKKEHGGVEIFRGELGSKNRFGGNHYVTPKFPPKRERLLKEKKI